MQKRFEIRSKILFSIFAALSLVFLCRLFFIQIIDDSYKLSAENQSLRYIDKYAPRGILFDRSGKKVVYNEPLYDLFVTPKFIDSDFDTIRFCQLFDLPVLEFKKILHKAKSYNAYKPSIFLSGFTSKEFAPMMEKMYLFPEFELRLRDNRKITSGIAAHVIGYVAEVSKKDLEQDSTYKMGDYRGKSGVEKTYENALRGHNGYEIYLADSRNVLKERFDEGEKDVKPVSGSNLLLTIDLELQKYAEKLMQGKKGAVVALEPESGEVLAFVSAPTYDPNILVGRYRSKNYRMLLRNDSLKPLFNRALMAQYPPGSIFKLIQGLAALDELKIDPSTGLSCDQSLVGCHSHPYASDLKRAVQYSCNPYFYKVFSRLLYDVDTLGRRTFNQTKVNQWKTKVESFGLGKKLGIDLPGERAGQVPSKGFYDRFYPNGRWNYSTIYSLSIGQGELMVTPLQMANLAAIMANRGYYYTPHLVKEISGDTLDQTFSVPHKVDVDPEYFTSLIQGMYAVVNEPGGTARRAQISGVDICGKTGTAQNPHGEDHSIFIAFAPMDNPKIAIAVYIENAGFGGRWAAPIASLVTEKYLKGTTDSIKEKRILDKRFY